MIDIDSVPNRYDNILATNGVEYTARDEHGNWLGDYILSLVDLTMKHTKDTHAALQKKYERAIKSKQLVGQKDREATAEMLVKMTKLRWTAVPFKKDGKELPFSEENALALFATDHPTIDYLIYDLNRFANDVENYKENDPKVVAKN